MKTTTGDEVSLCPGASLVYYKGTRCVSIHLPYRPGISSNVVNVAAAVGSCDDKVVIELNDRRNVHELAVLIASLFELRVEFVQETSGVIIFKFIA